MAQPSWLRIARDACFQHNRQVEWQAYLVGLLGDQL